MEYGYIKVIVRTAGGALPVPGAEVTVFSSTKEGSDVLFVTHTDASGNTEPIKLEAPDRSLSQSSEEKNVYATYNVTVAKDGFGSVENFHIPVFSGITSIQTVDMVPLPSDSIYSDYYTKLNEGNNYDL